VLQVGWLGVRRGRPTTGCGSLPISCSAGEQDCRGNQAERRGKWISVNAQGVSCDWFKLEVPSVSVDSNSVNGHPVGK